VEHCSHDFVVALEHGDRIALESAELPRLAGLLSSATGDNVELLTDLPCYTLNGLPHARFERAEMVIGDILDGYAI